MQKEAALKKTLRNTGIMILIGIAYYIFVKIAGFGIPCMFYLLLGLKCPSCGATRMFMHMAEGDFHAAFLDNRFLFFIWPLILFEIIYIQYKGMRSGKLSTWIYVLTYSTAIVFLGFGVVRNFLGW